MAFFTKKHIEKMINWNKRANKPAMVRAWKDQLKMQTKMDYFPKRNSKGYTWKSF